MTPALVRSRRRSRPSGHRRERRTEGLRPSEPPLNLPAIWHTAHGTIRGAVVVAPLWSFVICHLSHYFSDVVSEKSAGRVGVGGRDSRGVTQCSDPKGRNDSPGSNQKVIRTRRLEQRKGRWSRASIDPYPSLVFQLSAASIPLSVNESA